MVEKAHINLCLLDIKSSADCDFKTELATFDEQKEYKCNGNYCHWPENVCPYQKFYIIREEA